jgi:transcriptional regulator with XRE-family HTH domain
LNPGLIIKMLRAVDGLSQTVLAERIGVTRVYLSQVENNRKKPGLPFLRAVSKELDVPLALLLADDDRLNSPMLDELKKIMADLLLARLGSEGKQLDHEVLDVENS